SMQGGFIREPFKGTPDFLSRRLPGARLITHIAITHTRRNFMTFHKEENMASSNRGKTGPMLVAIAIGFASLTLPAIAAANSYPSKSIEIVVPYAPGGTNDVLGRTVAEAMGAEFKQSVIVLNKPGGSASVGSAFVARSAPDGYT